MKTERIVEVMRKYDSLPICSEERKRLGAMIDDIAENLKERDLMKVLREYLKIEKAPI